jgi:hypothetical protein
MTVTWTSGYDISEAYPFVEWGLFWSPPTRTPAGTITFNRGSLCGKFFIVVLLEVCSIYFDLCYCIRFCNFLIVMSSIVLDPHPFVPYRLLVCAISNS